MKQPDRQRCSFEINASDVDEETVDVLKTLITEQVDRIEPDDIDIIETLVLDGRPSGGLSSHANVLLTTDNTTNDTTNE